MTLEVIIVLVALVAMLTALIMDKMSGNDSILGRCHIPLYRNPQS